MIIKDSQITLFKENHRTKGEQGEQVYLDEIELDNNVLRHKSTKELLEFESGYDWSDMKDRKYIVMTFFYGFVYFIALLIFLSTIYVLGV